MTEINLYLFSKMSNPQCAEPLTPPAGDTEPSWTHLEKVDEHAVAVAQEICTSVAAASVQQVAEAMKWDALRASPVITTEKNGEQIVLKFGPDGRVISQRSLNNSDKAGVDPTAA